MKANEKLFERILRESEFESEMEFPCELNFEKGKSISQKPIPVLTPNDIINNILKSEHKPNILVITFQY